jgi:transcriptional regulator with XRE-family HTH domain
VSASQLLRASRRASGLTQGALAQRAGTSQPEISTIERGKKSPTMDTLERLLAQTGHRIVTVPSTGIDATEAAELIARAPARDVALRAYLDYSDALASVSGIDRVVLGLAEPRPTGSAAWDAALAALVDYWFSASRLPTPAWIDDRERFLDAPQSPQLGEYDLPPDVDSVPVEFARRNVLLERSTLASV